MLVSRRFALIRGIATPPFRRESARERRLALWLVLFQVVCDILATSSPWKRGDHAADPPTFDVWRGRSSQRAAAFPWRPACRRRSRRSVCCAELASPRSCEWCGKRSGWSLLAHAWIESDGRIVVDRTSLAVH